MLVPVKGRSRYVSKRFGKNGGLFTGQNLKEVIMHLRYYMGCIGHMGENLRNKLRPGTLRSVPQTGSFQVLVG